MKLKCLLFFTVFIIVVGFMDRNMLFCSARSIFESVLRVTPFCVISGKKNVIYIYIYIYILYSPILISNLNDVWKKNLISKAYISLKATSYFLHGSKQAAQKIYIYGSMEKNNLAIHLQGSCLFL